jgi:hypothetical protein
MTLTQHLYHLWLKSTACGGMHRLNCFVERTEKLSARSTFGAHFCSDVIEPKWTVTSSASCALNFIFIKTRSFLTMFVSDGPSTL